MLLLFILYFLFLCLKFLVSVDKFSCFLCSSMTSLIVFLCLRCCLMFPSLGCLFHQNQNVKSHWHHTLWCLSATSLSAFRQMELQSTVSKFESTETDCYRPDCLPVCLCIVLFRFPGDLSSLPNTFYVWR